MELDNIFTFVEKITPEPYLVGNALNAQENVWKRTPES